MRPDAQNLQALLFTRGGAVSHKEVCKLLEFTMEELTTVITELEQELAGSGLSLVTTEQDLTLTTAPEVAPLISRITQQDSALSPAAAEVLAVIAYRGPVSVTDVSVIRGVDSRRTVKALVAIGLVVLDTSIEEEEQYTISSEFLRGMGVTSREELPDFEKLSSDERVERALEE